MIGIRTAVQLAVFALLTFLALCDPALYRHGVILVLVPLIPLVLVFIVAPAAKTAYRESLSLRASFTWWQGLWLLLFLSGLVFRMRAAQDIDQSPLDVWALYRSGLVLIIGLILLGRLVSGTTKWPEALFSGSLGILVIYALFSLASTLWSVRPSWTLYKSIEYLVNLALISAVVVSVRSVRDYRKLVNWTWILLGLLVVSAWVGAIIDPADGLLLGENLGPLTVRLEGVLPSVDANTIGEICAILALVALHRLLDDLEAKHNRGWYVGLLLASLVTLVFSQTRSAMAAFVFGLAVLLLLTRRYVLAAAMGSFFAVCTVTMLTFSNFGRTFTDFLLRGQSAQSAEGLTGRMYVWHVSFDDFLRRPWTGYGGFAGSRFVVIPGIAVQQVQASSALSTYVDSLLDLGILGPLLVVIILAVTAWFLFRTTRNRHLAPSDRLLAIEMLVALSTIMVRSFVTTEVITHASLAFLAVIGFVGVARREEATWLRKRMLARAA
jgi:O-antigen ligase